MAAALLTWYDAHRRELPWRAGPGEPSDPYHVLVSEIMLQQTTVQTVRARFQPFINRFPSLHALAAARLDDVLHAWQGLGYYRRARGLHACAVAVVRDHDGVLPTRSAELQALPGLGPYTAAAIAAIAFGEPVLAVDANVERVLARLYAVETPLPEARRDLRDLALHWRPDERPGDVVQAVMDLGSSLCGPRSVACLACPLRPWCRGAALGLAADLPVKAPRRERPERQAVAFLLTDGKGGLWLRRRPERGVLAGLTELPSTPWDRSVSGLKTAQDWAPADGPWRQIPGRVRHAFTHFALTFELWTGEATPTTNKGFWHPAAELGALALPTLTKKLLTHGRQHGALPSDG